LCTHSGFFHCYPSRTQKKKIIIVVNFQQIFHKTNSLPFTNILKHFETFSPKLNSRQNCLAISIRRREKSTNCASRELRLQRFCFATYVYLKSFGLSRFVCFSRVTWNSEGIYMMLKYPVSSFYMKILS